MDDRARAVEQLQDAYRALGDGVASLRSMPTRNYASDEEQLRVSAATRAITEAEGLTAQACERLGRPAPRWAIEPSALEGGRGLGRPLVWGWIGQLHEARAELAATLRELGAEVPDDLPDGSPLEQLAVHPLAQRLGTLAFVVVVLGLVGYALALAVAG